MSLVAIAELLSGESLMSPGGAVDTLTATGGSERLWEVEGPFAATLPAAVPEIAAASEPAPVEAVAVL